jgi:hypothetical protein
LCSLHCWPAQIKGGGIHEVSQSEGVSSVQFSSVEYECMERIVQWHSVKVKIVNDKLKKPLQCTINITICYQKWGLKAVFLQSLSDIMGAHYNEHF